MLLEQLRGDHGPILYAQVLPEPQNVDAALGSFERPLRDLQLERETAIREQQAGGVIGDEIDQRLLHRAQHAVAVDQVTIAEQADGIIAVALTLIGDVREVVQVRVG